MKTNITVHGICKCQLEFINCTGTDKKNQKKEIKVFHCIYCKEKKTTNRKPQNKMKTKKGELFKLTLSLE